MRINTNVASMNAQQIANNTNRDISTSLEKLSSGHSINKASDDAAGLSISDKLRTQASSLQQGIKNANSGVAMVQMADKALEEVSNLIDTIKAKAVQSANEGLSQADRDSINADIQGMLDNIQDLFEDTDYNGTTLLNSTLTFQVGEATGETVVISSVGLTVPTDLASGLTATASSAANASTLMGAADSALTALNEARSKLGAGQLQLESSVRSNQVAVVSLNNAESIIRDTDYASESANFNKLNIISQAGMYAISQANTVQQNIQKLLQ